MSGTLAATLWWTARLGALLLVQVPWLRLLGPLWPVLAGALAFSLAGALALTGAADVGAIAGPAVDTPTLLRGVAAEALFGAGVGAIVGLPGHALIAAAATSSGALNLRRGAVEPLILALVLTASLGLGLHRPLLLGLRDFALVAPAGAGFSGLSAALGALPPELLAAAAAHLLALALALATPVLLCRATLEVATALVTAPGERPLALGPWLACVAAIVALTASWAAYPEAWLRALEPAGVGSGG